MFTLMCKGVWSIGNLQCTQPKCSLFCYSHNPALFETFIQTADRCCWQEHLVGLPVHKLIGAERKVLLLQFAAQTRCSCYLSREENIPVRVALEGQAKSNQEGIELH